MNVTHTQADMVIIIEDMAVGDMHNFVILEDMVMNVTHTQAIIVVLS